MRCIVSEDRMSLLLGYSLILACTALAFFFGAATCAGELIISGGILGVFFAASVSCVISRILSEEHSRFATTNQVWNLSDKIGGTIVCNKSELNEPLTREWWEENGDDTIAIRIPTRNGIGEY